MTLFFFLLIYLFFALQSFIPIAFVMGECKNGTLQFRYRLWDSQPMHKAGKRAKDI